ncbi:FMN-binding protein [Patescibacteria group bacterium]|nr:FMN-binding protein [Patescibacteria group bacterium]
MKKTFISSIFLFGFGAYFFYTHLTTAATANTSSTITQNNSITPTPITSPESSSTTRSPVVVKPVAPSVPKKSIGQYVDGSYIGSVADAYYGNIQVSAVISGGKLTDVTFLQYPNDRGTSISINRQAMPILRSEAIQAQSAHVNGVSGASDSSTAFEESLAVALARAKA